jgi:NACHT domain
VNSVRRQPRPRSGRRRAAGPLRIRLQRLWKGLREPFSRARRSRRTGRGRSGSDRVQRWRPRRRAVTATRTVSVLGAIALIALVIKSVAVVIAHRPLGFPFDPDTGCERISFSCDVLTGILLPILTLALASLVFLSFRLSSVHSPYVKKARQNPRELVPTAGSIIGEVVGRDQLCQVIIDDLLTREARRPHVVMGGVGTGKTALLVQLTRLLAAGRAVPVPIRLRDAQDVLDFRKLARERFLAEADAALLSDAEGEKVWRQLSKEDRIVVLADGLEEALIDDKVNKERDTLIRLAIRRAESQGLPLVIASRPHDSLRWMEAAVIEMEPLSEEAALGYIQQDSSRDHEQRLDWIVETADVAETPLYLQITRELHRAELLGRVSGSDQGEQLDTRSVDRAALRLRLLDTWMKGLIGGRFRSGLALSRRDREATVEQLSALACIGLRNDSLHVRFDELAPPGARPQTAIGSSVTAEEQEATAADDAAAGPAPDPPEPSPLSEELGRKLKQLKRPFDIRLAAIWGTELGLVEAHGDGVRFPHSIMQAYLGSRLIDVAMNDQAYRGAALEDPGRELLIALVMRSRVDAGTVPADGVTQVETAPRPDASERWREELLAAAGKRSDVKALNLYAAALEIDSVSQAPVHETIANELQERWPELRDRDIRTLEDAKLNLVRPFGAAARTIASKRRDGRGDRARPAYAQLRAIGRCERSYPVRLAAAQAIGSGGDDAFEILADMLRPPEEPWAERAGRRTDQEPASGRQKSARPVEEQIEEENREWRQQVMHAWLTPLLVGSVTQQQQAAQDNLEDWLRLVGKDAQGRPGGLPISLEAALAQGFKFAANRRRRHPHTRPETQAYLAEQAREMLRNARFWFSRLTLVHALCLWSLPDGPGAPPAQARRSDPRAIVDQWMELPGGGQEHPFVVEARRLTVWALETRQPERFIWIDESGIIGRVGSRTTTLDARRRQNLWIPPSTGWTALHPRAQQLVADVLLLLNLAERGERPGDRNRRLERTNRNDLPPCLSGDRSPLDPTRTVERAAASGLGSNCKDGCPFRLCPYPPKGEQPHRVGLSEAFCRRQQTLLDKGPIGRGVAPWQAALPSELKRFWRQMEQRAQSSELQRAGGDRGAGGRGRRRRLLG